MTRAEVAELALFTARLDSFDDNFGQLGAHFTQSEPDRSKACGQNSSEMCNYVLSRLCPMKK